MVMPAENIPNMLSDRSVADFDRHVFITCGKKDIEVSAPAINPSVSSAVMWMYFTFHIATRN